MNRHANGVRGATRPAAGSAAVMVLCLWLCCTLRPVAAGDPSDSRFSAAARPLARLQPLVGAWSGESRSPATQHEPEHSSPLQARFQWVLAHSHLEGRLTYASYGTPVEAWTAWSYDPVGQRYSLFWINNLSPVATLFHGDFEADGSMLLISERMIEDQQVTERMRLTFAKGGGWTLASDNDLSGDFVPQGTLTGKHRPED